MSNKIPPPPLMLSRLDEGDAFSFVTDHTRWIYSVDNRDAERKLPVVEITAEDSGMALEIVDKVNANPPRGILLGTCELDTGDLCGDSMVLYGRPVTGLLVEMVLDGELVRSVYPAPVEPISLH